MDLCKCLLIRLTEVEKSVKAKVGFSTQRGKLRDNGFRFRFPGLLLLLLHLFSPVESFSRKGIDHWKDKWSIDVLLCFWQGVEPVPHLLRRAGVIAQKREAHIGTLLGENFSFEIFRDMKIGIPLIHCCKTQSWQKTREADLKRLHD